MNNDIQNCLRRPGTYRREEATFENSICGRGYTARPEKVIANGVAIEFTLSRDAFGLRQANDAPWYVREHRVYCLDLHMTA